MMQLLHLKSQFCHLTFSAGGPATTVEGGSLNILDSYIRASQRGEFEDIKKWVTTAFEKRTHEGVDFSLLSLQKADLAKRIGNEYAGQHLLSLLPDDTGEIAPRRLMVEREVMIIFHSLLQQRENLREQVRSAGIPLHETTKSLNRLESKNQGAALQSLKGYLRLYACSVLELDPNSTQGQSVPTLQNN